MTSLGACQCPSCCSICYPPHISYSQARNDRHACTAGVLKQDHQTLICNFGQHHSSISDPPICAPALLPDALHAPQADPLPSLNLMSSACGGQLTWRMRHSTLWRCCLTRCMHSSRTFSRHRVLSCVDSGVRFARDMRSPLPDASPQTCGHKRLLANLPGLAISPVAFRLIFIGTSRLFTGQLM